MTKDKMKKILIACMILVCISVCPFNLIKKETTLYPELEMQYGVSDVGIQELKQTFRAQTGYLSQIAFDIAFPNGKPERGSLSVDLCKIEDDTVKVIVENRIELQEVNDGAFTNVPIKKAKQNKTKQKTLEQT